MGYYKRQDLPFYYALADAFTICDNYHCSVLGPTHPNRLMALSGTVDPSGHAGGPVLETNSSPDAVYSVHWDTMPEVLEDAGVSWKVYNPVGDLAGPTVLRASTGSLSDAILPYFAQYKNPNSALYQKAFLPQYPNDFAADVASGQLPAVSWLIPPLGYDEHPSAPPALGEWYTSQVRGHADVEPRGVVQDGAVPHVRRERRLLRPRAAAGPAGRHAGRVPDPAHRCRRRQGHPRPGRPGLPGAHARDLALQPGRPRGVRGLRPHLADALPRGALRGAGPQHLGLAAQDGGRPDARRCTPATPTPRCRRCPARPTTRRPTSWPRASPSSEILNIQKDMPVYPVPEHQSMPKQERV